MLIRLSIFCIYKFRFIQAAHEKPVSVLPVLVSPQPSGPSNFMKHLRAHRRAISSLMLALIAFWQIAQPLQAATFYWDGGDATASGNNTDGTGLGGTGTWDTSTLNWWDLTVDDDWPNTSADTAIFTSAFSALPTVNTVTLDAGGVTANKLSFLRSGYTIASETLTLAGASAGLHANLGESATIASIIGGTDGLTKTGGGSIRLTNAANSYTGITTIANGSLIINSAAALGGTGTVSIVTNNNTPLNTSLIGFGGGSLVLDGTAGGITFTRDVDFEGRGPIGDRGAAILSLGNNTLSGILRSAISPLPLSPTATIRNSRINSVNGTLTLSGTVNVSGTATTTFLALGGVNSAGVGNFDLTGILAGTGSIEKSGAGTLFLNPSSTSGFTGTIRISGSATGQQSSVRVTQASVGGTSIFGANTGTTTAAAIDLNGGVLEFRSDSDLNFGALASGKNAYNRAGSTIYTGPAAGGSGINGTTTLGALQHIVSTTGSTATTTFNSRNGFGVTFSTMTIDASTSGSSLTNTLTNNMGGNLIFTGNATLGDGNTASRPRVLAIGGGGNTVIQGSVIAGTDAGKSLTKSGAGNLTILGVGTTVAGGVSINGGALNITDFRSVNNNSAVINIGSSTTAGALIVGTSAAATVAGLTTNKVINLAGTTGTPSIYANQSGANPVILNANFVSTGVGAKTLTLGGTSSSSVDNIINGIIPNAGQSFTPNAALTSGGTVISFATTAGMAIGQYVTGAGIQVGATISAITGTSITLSAPTIADRAATDAVSASTGGGLAVGLTKIGAGTWVLNAANTYAGATTIQNGTLKLRATAAASDVINSAASNTIVFSANTTTGTAGGILEFRGFSGAVTTETLGALTPTAGAATIRLLGNGGSAANLTFTSLGATAAASSVNFDTTGAGGGLVTLTGQAATSATNLPGTANFQGHLYLNGADFATINGSAQVVAPTYAGAGNFQNALSALVASVHNKLTGSFTNGALTVSSLVTNSQTLTLSGNLVVSTGSILQSGGTATIQSDSGTSRLIQGGVAATNVAIRVDGASDVLNLGASGAPVNISSTTTGGLTKNGAGTLVINGINAQTGATTINEGTIKLGDFNTPRLSAANTALVIRQGAVLDLNGQSSGVSISSLDGAGIVTNSNAAAATLVVGNATTGAGTFAGIIQDGTGIVNVTKVGTTGAPTWSGLNTYTGVTTIGGTTGLVTVNILANGGVASGIGASTSAASNLVFAGTTAGLVYQGNILDGALTLGSRSASTDRLFTLSGSGATLSSTVSNNNAIVWSNTGAIVHGTNADRTLIFDGSSTGDNTFNPQITNSTGFVTSVTKNGAGQWNLGNSSNTYTGSTTVTNGILALNHNGALPENSPLLLAPSSATSAAVFQMSGTFERNLAATATAGSGTITFGGTIASTTGGVGFAAHSTELLVAIGGTGSPTALTWGSGGFVGTAFAQNLVLNSTTALSSVDFRNAIDLGASARTINVLDNGNTGADYATMSGVLSGAGGGIVKIGAGILRLTGANTYTGLTQVQAGTLVVQSLGSSTGGASSSVGAGGVAMDNTNAIQLGAGGNNAGILQYVGPGETSDRKIRFNSTTGTSSTNQIHADGSGPLILTNVANDMAAGAKTVVLRGSNTGGNMITSVLADNGGALSITVDGGATWILTGTNTFTGNLTSSAGALGIGDAAAVGSNATGSLVNGNGNIFAYGADRTITRALTLSNNATNGWLGDYSLLFTGANNLAAGANNVTTNNSIIAGKTLTFQGVTANALTANRAWIIDGAGETVINGDFTTSTAFGVRFDVNGGGTLTLGTNGATSNWNQSITAVDVDRGTLKFTTNNAIPTVATSGGITISPEIATTDTATVDLNGTNQTVNSLTANSNGTITIDNTAAGAASFTFGANDAVVNLFNGTGTYTITDSGAGALSITKAGNSAVTVGSGNTLSYQGTTAVSGGSFTIQSVLNGTSGISVTGASTLALTGGITTPSAVTSVVVHNGSTLSLLDGAGSQFDALTTLQLGSTGGTMTTLNLNVGDQTLGDDLQTDTFALVTGGTLSLFAGNQITFNLTDAGLNASQTYELLNVVDGGLTTGPLANTDYLLGATPGGFSSIVLTATDTSVFITTGTLITGNLFWRGLAGGGTDDTWNANVNNWSQDKANTMLATTIPGQGTDVVFAIDSATGAVTTTLEQNFKINSLTFEAGTTTPTSVTIAPGAISTNRLEVAPQDAMDGIAITTGGPAAVTISAPLKIGADQTWTVADAVNLTGATFATASTAITVADTTGLLPGMLVVGTGIPAGATVASVTNGTSFVLSTNTTAAGASIGLAASSTLTLSGGLQGEKDVTKAGAGKVILGAAADSTFNIGLTSDFTVAAGNLEITNVGALGSTANSNAANLTLTGGGFYYNGVTWHGGQQPDPQWRHPVRWHWQPDLQRHGECQRQFLHQHGRLQRPRQQRRPQHHPLRPRQRDRKPDHRQQQHRQQRQPVWRHSHAEQRRQYLEWRSDLQSRHRATHLRSDSGLHRQ
jgi:autotransporter-associated beta strand protein